MKVGIIVEWSKIYSGIDYKELLFNSHYEMQLFQMYSGSSGYLDLSDITGNRRKRYRKYLSDQVINIVQESPILTGLGRLDEILPYPLGLPKLIESRGESQYQLEFKFRENSEDIDKFYDKVYKFCKEYKFYYSIFDRESDALFITNKL